VDYARTQKALDEILRRLESKAAKGKMSREDKDKAAGLLQAVSRLEDAQAADLVLECIYEDMQAKKQLYADMQPFIKESCILASNTSSISITALAASIQRPERFIGMHFFNPVPLMKLLEITRGLATGEEALEAARFVGGRMNKVMVFAKDAPGFIVNRVMNPMLNEAVQALDEGIGSVEDIDDGLKFGCNYPMGPLELTDLVGLDVLCAVMETLHREMGEDKYRPAPLLKKMVRAGWLGKKTGRGFYLYGDGGKSPNPQIP
jgi:3-hydroxybutyryl-CoA dehydrogenase